MSQNSQENTCARVSFLIKLQALGLYQFPADLVTFIEEILDKKVHFLCSVLLENILFKGTLMQIWKSTNIFVFIWK